MCEEQLPEVNLKADRDGIVGKVKLSQDEKALLFQKMVLDHVLPVENCGNIKKSPSIHFPQWTAGKTFSSTLAFQPGYDVNTPAASPQLYQLQEILLRCLPGVLRKHREAPGSVSQAEQHWHLSQKLPCILAQDNKQRQAWS